MAFKIITNFAGIEIADAYARFEDINGGKDNLDMQMAFYTSHQACLDGAVPFKRQQFSFTPDLTNTSSNYHKQAYEKAKLEPEFERAIDV